MLEVQRHRGPDDSGVFVDESHKLALAHTRLSIIDLSSAGHQPMSYRGGRYWIVFNGEIYNYQALRADLIRHGHEFASATDTEVVLAAYAEWGEQCVERLRGMFAFAIYDRGEGYQPDSANPGDGGQLFLARDRFGIKPLYLAWADGMLLFASEVRALLASDRVRRRVDPHAIWDYLSYGAIRQPRTILTDVQALEPGHWMVVGADGTRRVHRYWHIVEATAQARQRLRGVSLREAAGHLRQELETATRLHMLADVPVGAFLSGGVDSTVVVGLMANAGARPIRTYSVGFAGTHPELDESVWARLAAQHYGTDHTEVTISDDDVRESYEQLVWALDEPSHDGANTYFVSRAARRDVVVSLSGLGGDELFAGYPHFRLLRDKVTLARVPLAATALQLAAHVPIGRIRARAAAMVGTADEYYSRVRRFATDTQRQALASPELAGLIVGRPANTDSAVAMDARLDSELDSVADTSEREVSGYLVDTLLRDTDAVSMAHSLEVRPVLLDHVVAEYAFALPGHAKLAGRRHKAVLKAAVADLLPPGVATRPKLGFELPFGTWMRGPLAERVASALTSPEAGMLFGPAGLAELRRPAVTRNDRATWAYVVLVDWLSANRCYL